MHKFTIFTIIFSAIVVITVGELVVHDYLSRHAGDAKVAVVQDEVATEPEAAEPEEIEDEAIVDEVEMPAVELTPTIPEMDFESFGFTDGFELTEKLITNGIFSFLQYESNASEPFYWELFYDGEYAASLYEIVCENPTEAFTVYTDLRESGAAQPDNGDVNEVNNYGEASFYFNHSTKTTTIFLVVMVEDRVYAFNYGHKYHAGFKELFSTL